MSINKFHLKELISKCIEAMDLYSSSAVNLIMGTAAQESKLSYYLKQLNNGCALGFLQMEPKTFEYHCKYLNDEKRAELRQKIFDFCGINELKFEYLEFNLAFAICMTRIHYYRIRAKLPEHNDIEGLAAYWKKYYNSVLGAGTEDQFIKNYIRFI